MGEFLDLTDVKPRDVMAALKAWAEEMQHIHPDASRLMLDAAELIDQLCLESSK